MSTLWILAAPGLRATRTRLQAIAAGSAVSGALLLIAAALFRVPAFALPPRDSTATTYTVAYDDRYSSLVTSAETRIGVATAVLLLAGTALLLAWQAVSSGSARRARRHDALATSGATPAQLRRLGALDVGAGGLAGGVLAGPVYLLLWFLLGPAQPPVSRLLPDLALADLTTWVAVILGLTAAAAAAGAWTATLRPGSRQMPGWSWALVSIAGVVVVPVATTIPDRQTGVAAVCGALVLVLVGVLGAGRPWVTARAARMRRSGHPDQVLAAGGLTAIAGSAGRAAGVLVGAGITLGVAAVILGNTIRQARGNGYGWVLPDHLPGVVLAAAAAGIAVLVALTTLTLTAVDDLHTSTRALAAFAAAGADLDHVQALQRRRLRAVTLPPLATGLLLGGIGFWALNVTGEASGAPDIWPLLIVGPAALGLTALGTRWVAALVRTRTAEALHATNLRVA